MAEPKKDPLILVSKTKTLKRCECGATRFQGPFTRGDIVDGVFRVQETVYQCLGCNRVRLFDEIPDHTVEHIQ